VGVKRFTDLRAWQACVTYKRAIYRVVIESPLCSDWKRRDQLEDSVAGPPSHVAEGYGRFSPPDFARFLVMARASLMESQNHLLDAVDKRYITETTRLELNALAETALEEVTGLMEYLHTPEALRNARRAREHRIATRQQRRTQNLELGTASREAGTGNHEGGTANHEGGTANHEAGNREPRSGTNPEPRTRNREAERRTPKRNAERSNFEPNLNTNREVRTEKGEL